MPGVARHMTLVVAACLKVALPLAAPADTSSPQALVVSLWTEFSERCVPLIVNPEKARENFPETDLGFTHYETDDARMTMRQEGYNGSFERGNGFEIVLGQKAAYVTCDLSRSRTEQPFSATALASAFEQLVSQSEGVELIGGTAKLVDGVSRDGELQKFYGGSPDARTYFVAGALGDRPDFIEANIFDGFFNLYVAATVLKEDWK